VASGSALLERAVQWADWICPLTPLENVLRRLGGETGYSAGFIEHFVLKFLYPEELALGLRYVLGPVLIAVNVLVYAYVILDSRRGNISLRLRTHIRTARERSGFRLYSFPIYSFPEMQRQSAAGSIHCRMAAFSICSGALSRIQQPLFIVKI
jgi:hypothetical protein